jgi:peroxiredoxin
MNYKLKIIFIFVVIFVFCAAGLTFGQYIPNAPFKPVKLPDFTLKDLKGNKFTLSKQIGKPVLLFFGATWCPSCRSEIPAYKNIHETYSKRGLIVIYINITEPAAKVAKFVKAHALPYKVLLDEEGSVAESYGIVGVPTMILIDKEGRIIQAGHSTEELPLNKLFPVTK